MLAPVNIFKGKVYLYIGRWTAVVMFSALDITIKWYVLIQMEEHARSEVAEGSNPSLPFFI